MLHTAASVESRKLNILYIQAVVCPEKHYTELLKMIVRVFVIHNTLEIVVYVFFYLIEQHSKFLLRTLQVLYLCTLCDSTNINTIIEFVPHKTPSHCRSPPS